MENDIGLISEAMDMGFRFTVVSVMSRIKDSVNLLKASLEMTDDFDVQHVAVKIGRCRSSSFPPCTTAAISSKYGKFLAS